MRWLWEWFCRRPDVAPPRQVVLYTRAGCHLCDAARHLLAERQRHYGFALGVEDVDADPVLAASYGERVPVVVIDGTERFYGHVNPALLDRLLKRLCNS